MIRELICGATITAAVVSAPGLAIAAPAGETDVPNMVYNAVLGTPCSTFHRFIFGRTSSGQALACVSASGQGNWVMSSPLHGVQQIGASCGPGDGAAQTPDGRGLICTPQGWQPN